MTVDFLGIARERVYSPGKEDADRQILEAVAAALGASHRVAVVDAEDPLPPMAPARVVFAMCQGPAALEALRRWERAGVRVVNSAAAIGNTHRVRMLEAFARHGVPHPPSVLVDTAGEPLPPLPPWAAGDVWVKRGDVHATEAADVVPVSGRAALAAALAAMRRRGIACAVVQRHAPGDVHKFYAVRGHFFACFPPSPGAAPLSDTERARMRELGEAGAAALGLEVFGGDCVRGAGGELTLIDLNDWPSYGRCRSGAAQAIAAYLRTTREDARSIELCPGKP